MDELLAGPDDVLRNFTNRGEEIRLVRQWLNAPAGSALPMQMFFGVGGAGKTMFVARLRQILKPEALPIAIIDFDTGSGSKRFTNDIPATLFEVSRQLGVVCPRFELAYFRLLELMNQTANLRPGSKSESLLTDLAESTAGEVAGKVLEAAEVAPLGVGALVKLARVGLDYINAPARQKAYREYRSEEEGRGLLAWLAQADADRIARNLKDFLAMDLAHRLPERAGKGARALIVFDTLEHLRRSGLSGRQQFTDREQWIFDLWKVLQTPGRDGQRRPFVQFILLGRDRLKHWEDYCAEIGTLGALEQHPLDGFSEKDAREFLVKHQISDRALQDAILHSALDVETHATVKGYHAMSLGLLADTVTVERQAGREPDPRTLTVPPGKLDELANRFLQSLSTPTDERRIVRLARTPRFDEKALEELCSPDRDANVEERRRILAFTFVQDTGQAGWFTLHPRMREGMLSLPKYGQTSEVREHHSFWVKLWSGRSERSADSFASLAWFHHYQLDRDEALKTWTQLAKRARQEMRMQDHLQMVDWWALVGLETDGNPNRFKAKALNVLAVELGEAGLGLPSQNLGRAIACLRHALEVFTREDSPQQWAATQKNLGITLCKSGMHTGGEQSARLLGEAVAAHRAALEVFTRQSTPQDWAKTQCNLGTALYARGDRMNGEEGTRLLGEAVAAHRAALQIQTRPAIPQDWAITQANLGTALKAQALRTGGEEGARLLGEVVVAYRAALEVFTRQELPENWANNQYNLGNALAGQGIHTGGEAGVRLLGEAVAAYRAALEFFTLRDWPLNWAMTQNNLGRALNELGMRTRGEAGLRLLGEAVAAHRAAVEVGAKQDLPEKSAERLNNLGNALLDQGIVTGGEAGARLLGEAVAAYRSALEVFTRAELPQDWAMTQNNLGAALRGQGIRTGGEEGARLLGEAVVAYRSALEVATRAELPQDWAMTQNNLGVALRDQGIRTGGEAGARLLGEAVAACRGALEVRTREHLPHDWAMTQGNLAAALRQQASRTSGEEAARLQAEAEFVLRAVEDAGLATGAVSAQSNHQDPAP